MLGFWSEWWLHNYDYCEFVMLINNVEVELSLNLKLFDMYIYFQLFMLIMIDVKLTPSGFDHLPVCMNE